jgi:RimJ/RimL family protein N-acetyltransferase
MPRDVRWSVEWSGQSGLLRVVEPTPAEVAAVLTELAGYYNDPHNRTMMAHTMVMSPDDVREYYEALWADADRPMLLFLDGALVGDADLRGIQGGAAEFAIMLGARSLQGKGLGTSFGVMAHALAFQSGGLDRLYVSIVPNNRASLRLFEKLGYEVDDGAEAREYVDDDTDVTMSVTRARFEALHAPTLHQLRLAPR